MAIIWADFPSGQHGLYGTSTASMLNGIWAETQSGSSGGTTALANDPDSNIGSAGRVLSTFGGNVNASNGHSFARIVNPSGAQATTGVGFRLWMSSLPQGNSASGNAIVRFRTSANADIIYFQVQADGSIGAYDSANTLLGSTAPATTANAFQHVEIKVLRHASAGTAEVRVNGAVVLDLDTLALGASDIGIITIGSRPRTTSQATPTNYWKDFVLWDGSGSEGNNFQGSVAVHDLYTDGDISLNWTPSTGSTGWDLLDKTSVDDTTYIQAGDPAPSPAVMSLTDLPADVTSVRALLPIVRAVKSDGGDCNIQVSLTPNNVDWDDGADRPMTTAFTFTWDVSHLSPDTSAAWTPAEVNDAYVKFNRTL
jgi:hypothetical protein